MTDRMTLDSLHETASSFDQTRRGRFGDGVRRGEGERGGMGLFEASMRETGDRFELVYSTGGHGGPYTGEAAAKKAAERLLKGGRDRWIAVIPASQITNLKKAKGWLLTRTDDEDTGTWKDERPLPNVSPRAHNFETTEAKDPDARKVPGLPTGWSSFGKSEARWTSKSNHEYRIENKHGGWLVFCFKPDARTGDKLKVSDFDAKWKRKMPPGLAAGEDAKFVHGFDAAEASMDYDKGSKEESADFARLRDAIAECACGGTDVEKPVKKKTRDPGAEHREPTGRDASDPLSEAAHVFPSGARVYIDGKDEAIIRQAFPKGSSSYMWPHYKVDFVGGDKNVAVAMKKVGVVKKKVHESGPTRFGDDPQKGDWLRQSFKGQYPHDWYFLASGERQKNGKFSGIQVVVDQDRPRAKPKAKASSLSRMDLPLWKRVDKDEVPPAVVAAAASKTPTNEETELDEQHASRTRKTVLGAGMSKAALARDTDDSDREYIAYRQQKMRDAERQREAELPANIIWNQLGRIRTMIGAKNQMSDNNGKTLHFRIGRNAKGITWIRITVEPTDTYHMEFGKRTGKVATDERGVQGDQMGAIIRAHTGLYTNL